MNKIYTEHELLKRVLNPPKEAIDLPEVIGLSGGLNREIYIPEVLEGCGSEVDAAIRYWNRVDEDAGTPVEDRQPILVYIDCNGGQISDAFSIYDSIRLSKTPVHTITSGVALSGGFIIAIAGHKRIAYPHSSFLFHEGSGSFEGDANKFANFSQFYKRQLLQMRDIILERTKISLEKYNEIKTEDYWMTSEEAKDLGVIDEIVGETNEDN